MSTTLKSGVTAVVLAKNDPAQLDRCLESIRPAVDEVLVVDPGLAEGWQEAINKNGVKIYKSEWRKAYDVALNPALGQVETEWTLRIDSDEWLEEPSVEGVKQVVQTENCFLATVIRVDHLPEDKTSEHEENRMWRTHPDMRYQGRVFEQIWPESLARAAEGRAIARTAIRIHSDAPQTMDVKERAKQNLELIELEVEEHPERLFYRMCLADTLRVLEREGEAREVFDALVDDVVRKNKPPAELVAVMVVARAISEFSGDEMHSPRAGKLVKYSLQWLSEFPPVMWTVMEFERRRDNLRAAYNLLRQLDQMGRTNRFNRALAFNPAIVREAAWAGILELAPKIGKEEVVPKYQQLLYQAQRMRS